jgi:hypothetical protein
MNDFRSRIEKLGTAPPIRPYRKLLSAVFSHNETLLIVITYSFAASVSPFLNVADFKGIRPG